MKTSVIRHPDNNIFVIRREWQLRLLATPRKGEKRPKRDNTTECGAEILSVLEYHRNNPMANRMLKEQFDLLALEGHGDLDRVGGWRPYSYKYLQELLLNGRSIGLITPSVELLVERGVVSNEPPADLLKVFNARYTWLHLNVDFINDWIDTNMPKGWIDRTAPKSRRLRHPNVQTEESLAQDAKIDTVEKIVNTLCKYYIHVHAKNGNFVIDSDRRSKVKARMKEPGRTIGMGAQAIIGNLMSDYHQARHPENDLKNGGKLYDDIELIFPRAKNFENHVRYAEDAKITEETALNDLEAFVSGTPSVYAKKTTKASQNAPDRQETAVLEPPANAKQYREFAQAIASFFTTNVSNPEIMEFCKTQSDLVKLGNGLTDSVFLVENIDRSVRTFRPTGPTADMMKQITDFAGAFCKIQELNREDAYGEAF